MKHSPENRQFSDLDLMLYLNKSMPLGKRLLFKLFLLKSSALRKQLAELKIQQKEYKRNIQPGLHRRLFPNQARAQQKGSTGTSIPLFAGWNWSRAGLVLVPLLIMALVFFLPGADEQQNTQTAFLTPKGSLGVNLYIKSSDSIRMVSEQRSVITSEDTLQIKPTAASYLGVWAWSTENRLEKVFSQDSLKLAGPDKLPPALILDGGTSNKLICVTSPSPQIVLPIEKQLQIWKGLFPQDTIWNNVRIQSFSIETSSGESSPIGAGGHE
jgi:hypothetical protein